MTTVAPPAAPRREPGKLRAAGATFHGRWPDIALVSLPAIALLWLGWRRRWISDDGLIFTRVVRQLLAGHGPVYNVGERAESATSTLWTYVVAAITWITGADPARVAVVTGLLMAAAGLAFAVDATRRLWRARPGAVLLPVGAVVVLALPPFWNFATSGLDTSLAFCWIGGLWWLLVRLRQRRAGSSPAARPLTLRGDRDALLTAFVAGLGPLIRPELAIVAVVFGGAVLVSVRPLGRLRPLLLVGAWILVPLGYEVFRAAYFGILVPLPAVAKAASGSDWHRGFSYVRDFVGPYWLAAPLALLLAIFMLASRRRSGAEPSPAEQERSVDRLLVGVPVASGLVMTLYVARVGGDFMHARMLLAPLLLVLLPVLVLPVRRLGAAAAVALVAWAAWSAAVPRPDVPTPAHPVGAHGIVDERAFWVHQTATGHPTDAAPFIGATRLEAALAQARSQVSATGRGVLVVVGTGANPTYRYFRLRRGLPWPIVVITTNLGRAGAAASLGDAVIDPEGLAYPLAAHSQLIKRGRPGHEKTLPLSYVIADLVDPAVQVPGQPAAAVGRARQELACPSVKRLLESTRDPVTIHRGWTNLVHALGMTGLEVPIRLSAAPSARGC